MPEMNLVPTDRLTAVNIMLRAINEAPLNTLDDPFTDAQTAINLLEEVSREVQSVGYRFNTVLDVTLPIDGSGNISVASNVLDAWPHLVDRTQPLEEQSFVLRGTKLFNLKDNSFVFTESQRVDLVYMIDWGELNEPARKYIIMVAARRLQADIIGSEEKEGFKDKDENKALRDFRRSVRKSVKPNMFRDNIRMAELLGRRAPRRSR